VESLGEESKPTGIPNIVRQGCKWKDKLEKLLQTDEKITLLALGNVKFDVLKHIHRRRDIEIMKLETRYMKKREKGTGVKVTVRKRIHANPLQK